MPSFAEQEEKFVQKPAISPVAQVEVKDDSLKIIRSGLVGLILTMSLGIVTLVNLVSKDGGSGSGIWWERNGVSVTSGISPEDQRNAFDALEEVTD